MKNKILFFDFNKNLKTLNKGGGSPVYLKPENINFLDDIYKHLQSFNKKLTNEDEIISFNLLHKDDFPAISNRFVSGMKTIFGDINFEYKTTRLIEDKDGKEKLIFIYEVQKIQLENALYRLKEIKYFLIEVMKELNITIEEFFDFISIKKFNEKKDNEIKNFIENKIKRHFNNLSLSYISKTSLIRLLSTGYHKYKSIELTNNERLDSNNFTNENEIKFVSFTSTFARDEMIKELRNKKINFQKMDETSISIKNIDINNSIELKNVVYIETIQLKKDNLNDFNNSNTSVQDYIYKKFQKNQKKNNINVGVIDGGLQNEEFKKYIFYHGIEEFKSIKIKPISNHAEEVCSIILFGNELSPSMNDNCEQPNVHLFDVVHENITIDDLLNLIEEILSKYSNEIKIWNLSVVVESLIVQSQMWKYGISSVANKLDQLQKKYEVLFIFSSGNKNNEFKDITIKSPSDSMLGISVTCAIDNDKPCDYSLSGETKKNKYFAIKPDFAIKTERNNGSFTVISNGCISRIANGTSYASPWVTRKVAQLLKEGFELFSIPCILNSIVIFKNKNSKINDYLGYGILPNDINEILDFKNNESIIVTKVKIEHYNQGFFEIKLPKSNKNNFPLEFVMSINVVPRFSEAHSFEYIEDTARVQFGAVNPFKDINNPSLEQNWKISKIAGDADDAMTKENSLRQYFDKYKNRYSSVSFINRPKRAFITKNGRTKEIEHWGFSIVRNDIRSRREGKLDVYICLIISNILGESIYQELINMNHNYIINKNINVIKSSNVTDFKRDEEDIEFE